jgi:hypothetical protein
VPARDWDTEEGKKVAKRDTAIKSWQSNTNAIEVKGAAPKAYRKANKPAWLVKHERGRK